jgi:hypothetical protein
LLEEEVPELEKNLNAEAKVKHGKYRGEKRAE